MTQDIQVGATYLYPYGWDNDSIYMVKIRSYSPPIATNSFGVVRPGGNVVMDLANSGHPFTECSGDWFRQRATYLSGPPNPPARPLRSTPCLR